MKERSTLNTVVSIPVKATVVPPTRYVPHNAPPPADLIQTPKKVSGRTRAVMLLEEVIGRSKNMVALDEALQAEFEEDPTKFFRIYIMPFMPKKVKLEEHGLPVEIRLVNVNLIGEVANVHSSE